MPARPPAQPLFSVPVEAHAGNSISITLCLGAPSREDWALLLRASELLELGRKQGRFAADWTVTDWLRERAGEGLRGLESEMLGIGRHGQDGDGGSAAELASLLGCSADEAAARAVRFMAAYLRDDKLT